MLTFAALKALLSRFWPLLAIAAVIGLLLLTYCEGKDAGTSKADRARLEANVKAGEAKSRADEKAADTRLQDAQRANTEQAELKEAVNNAPDPASARRAHYRCIRLQQAARASGHPAPACV